MMMVALLASTVGLTVILVQELLEPQKFLLDAKEMLTVFAFFLMVLIGLELVETIKMSNFSSILTINSEGVY